MSSLWEENDLDLVLRAILVRCPGDALSVYAIARIIEDEYPDVFEALGLPIGGQGTEAPSLSRYLARYGKARIDHGYLEGIEYVTFDDLAQGEVAAHGRDGQPILTSVAAPSGFRLQR